ncbi:Carboxylesterase family [Seminavis robusta]|uniref:Carboxylesterase family n=1 Tax=Seminavis robusta TaxID=568900 RepID=A0A9N8EGZ2_9STRA|nr:Carboxylesterase family [Seminavis robusta]|eukprot:Sro988_g228310.1 Carboxylesterase family (437) ;mRNA; f:5814-7124
MTLIRTVWIAVVGYLSFGPIVAPFPWLGFLGGFVKLIGFMNGGTLLVLHSLMLLAYASLFWLGLVSRESLKTPATISTLATIGIFIPTVLCLLTCSPEWVNPGQATNQGILSVIQRVSQPKGISWAKWITPPQTCPSLDGLENITTIYRRSVPPYGPSSTGGTFLNPVSKIVFDALNEGDGSKTNLRTMFYPVTSHQRGAKKAGMLVFVHGGGWFGGEPDNVPSGCYASMAHEHGWAYAAVEYRLGRSGWSGDVQVKDVKDGIKHLIKTHSKEVDASKVVLVSSSAGGHLALLASFQLNNERANLDNPVVAGVLAVAPSTSVDIGTGKDSIPGWAGSWSEVGATMRLCEGVEECNKRLSPLEHVTSFAPKTILLHGGHDEYYTKIHSRTLAKKLSEHNVSHVHMEPPLMPHCLDVAHNTIPFQMAMHATINLMKSL